MRLLQKNELVVTFEEEIYDVFDSKERAYEVLSLDLISTFRPHSLQTCLKGISYKWFRLLPSRDVYVNGSWDFSRSEALEIPLLR